MDQGGFVSSMVDAAPATRHSKRALFWLLVLLGVLAFVVKGYRDERVVLHFRDFKQPYASARCLLHGCDPYSESDTRAEFLRAGGLDTDAVVFQPYSALYPPFSFVVLTPVAMLEYRVAHAVWFVAVAGLFSVAALLMAELCLLFPSLLVSLLLAAFVASSTILLMLGQISGPVIALLAIGLWCVVRGRLLPVAALALALALALKPHDAFLLVLYLPLAGRAGRRVFWWGLAPLTLLAVLGGTWWVGHQPAARHWLPELRANLKGNSTAGNVNDPVRGSVEAIEIADLQAAIAPLDSQPAQYNLLAAAVTAVLLLGWLYPALRMRPSLLKHLLALAALASLTLLPIYHRQYDTRLLLLVFPAVAALIAERPRWGYAGLGLLAVATVVTAHTFLTGVIHHESAHMVAAGRLQTVLLYRPLPLAELALVAFLICALWSCYLDERAPGAPRQA